MTLVLSLAGIFPLVVATLLVSPLARDLAEERAQDSLRREANGLADGLGLWLDEALRNTKVIASTPGLESALGDERVDLEPRLQASLDAWEDRAVAFELWTLDGQCLASTRSAPTPVTPGFTPFGPRPHAQIDTLKSIDGQWTVRISAPVGGPDHPVAVILCTWDASPLIRTAGRVNHDSCRVGILHRDGRMVCIHSNQEVQRAATDLIHCFDPQFPSSLTGTFLQGENELHLTAVEPLRGPDSSTSSPIVPFVLAIARPRADARAEAAELERAILFSGLGVTLAICLAACVLARILGSPLQQLVRRVEGFAVRTPAPAVEPSRSRNELQRLSDAFDQMADRVEQHQEALFERHVELQTTLQRLRATDQVKDEFLSFLSHEMKTPLTSIRSFAELLRTTPQVSDDEQEEFLTIIESECIRLETLSNDLLDLARIQLGEMPWRDQLVDPSGVIESVVRTLRVLAERSGAHLLTQCGPGLPPLMIDRDRLVQVITNLVANALKFTPAGGQVTVRASANNEGEVGQLNLQILDTGPGIPEQLLKDVFDPFVQAHASDSDTPRGSGLGLAICQRIIEHYGGDIRARNGDNGGAILELNLPVAPHVLSAY